MQRTIGLLFLLIGIIITGVSLLPALQHPPASPLITILIIGIAVSVFGALLVPSSHAETALKSLTVIIAPYVPRFGGSRAGDPPVPPPSAL